MIIVTNIEYIDTGKNNYYHTLVHKRYNTNTEVVNSGKSPSPGDLEYVDECIKGRRFRHPSKNIDVVLGNSARVNDVLGLQYEAFENLRKENIHANVSLERAMLRENKLESKLKTIRSLGFIGRLIFLFTKKL